MSDFGDFRIFEYFRAAGARALRQRLSDIDRVGIAVARDVDSANYIIDVDDICQRFDFIGRHDMNRQVEHFCHRSASLQFLEPFRIGRHRD